MPNRVATDTDTYYPVFFLDEETNWYDYKVESFTSKKLHQKYLDETDVAWNARYWFLEKRQQQLYVKCRNKYWKERKQISTFGW